jgi:predicted transcriptional regulator
VLKKIFMLYSIAVTIAVISFFAGKITTENRLVEQHRLELDAARERAAILTDTITRAAETNRELGESLSRQRTSVSELRALITEVRARYEKMEELLSLSRRGYDFDDRSFNCTDISNGEQVE